MGVGVLVFAALLVTSSCAATMLIAGLEWQSWLPLRHWSVFRVRSNGFVHHLQVRHPLVPVWLTLYRTVDLEDALRHLDRARERRDARHAKPWTTVSAPEDGRRPR